MPNSSTYCISHLVPLSWSLPLAWLQKLAGLLDCSVNWFIDQLVGAFGKIGDGHMHFKMATYCTNWISSQYIDVTRQSFNWNIPPLYWYEISSDLNFRLCPWSIAKELTFFLMTAGFLRLTFFFLNFGRKRSQFSFAMAGFLASSLLIISVLMWYMGWMLFMQSTITFLAVFRPYNATRLCAVLMILVLVIYVKSKSHCQRMHIHECAWTFGKLNEKGQ